MVALQSVKDESTTGASPSHQSEYPERLPRVYYATDGPIRTCDAQPWTAMGMPRTTNEVDYDSICDKWKGAKRNMKEDRVYTIVYIARHVGKGANTRYAIR